MATFTLHSRREQHLQLWLLLQQSFIKTEVIYGPSVRSASSAYTSEQAQQPSAPKAEGSKFCMECGTANLREAKLYRECGHKF